MRRRRVQLPPPPLSLFIFLLTLIYYFSFVAPDLERRAELIKQRQLTAQMCSISVYCGDQLD